MCVRVCVCVCACVRGGVLSVRCKDARVPSSPPPPLPRSKTEARAAQNGINARQIIHEKSRHEDRVFETLHFSTI